MNAPLRSAVSRAVAPLVLLSVFVSGAIPAGASPFKRPDPRVIARPHPIQVEGGSNITGAWLRLPPPALNEGAIAYDTSRDRLLVFGGSDSEVPTNELWQLSLAGTPTWSRVVVTGTLPAARSGHNLFYDSLRDRLLLFGGHDGSSSTMNDIWSLELATPPLMWQQGAPPGDVPGSRSFASAVYDSIEDRIILFGGAHEVGDTTGPADFRNDVWEIPLDVAPAWNELSPTGTPPGARAGATVVYDSQRGRMVMFGGYDGAMWNDTWELTLGATPQWNPITTTGGPPSERAIGAALYDAPHDRLVMYGGLGDDGGGDPEDVWELVMSTNTWNTLSPTGSIPTHRDFPLGACDRVNHRLIIYGGRSADGGTVADVACALSLNGAPVWSHLGRGPEPRERGRAVYDHLAGKVIVFGGTNGADAFDDVWEFDVSTGRWAEWSIAGTLPSGRSAPSAIYDPVRHRLVSFGGNDGPVYSNEMWALTLGGTPAWTQIIPTVPPGEAPAGTSSPSARSGHSAVYDAKRDRMVIYGGTTTGGAWLSDAWSFDFATSHWTFLTPGVGPGARVHHAAVWDDLGDRMLLFSGQSNNGDLWEMPYGGNWNELSPAGGSPSGRYGAAAVYDTAADAMLIFGGPPNGGGGWMNDTWILTLRGVPTWHSVATTGSHPRGREQAAAAYDQTGARLFVFGGLESNDHRLADAWALLFDRTTPVQGAMVRGTARVDRVELSWAMDGALSDVRIERRDAASAWRTLAIRDVSAGGRLDFVDHAVSAGARYAYRLADRQGVALTREEWIEVPRGASVELAGFVPNPSRGDVRLAFTLADARRARVEVVDLAGRRVFEREVGSLGAGRHVLPLDGARLAPGVYTVRLVAESGATVARRAVVLQ